MFPIFFFKLIITCFSLLCLNYLLRLLFQQFLSLKLFLFLFILQLDLLVFFLDLLKVQFPEHVEDSHLSATFFWAFELSGQLSVYNKLFLMSDPVVVLLKKILGQFTQKAKGRLFIKGIQHFSKKLVIRLLIKLQIPHITHISNDEWREALA